MNPFDYNEDEFGAYTRGICDAAGIISERYGHANPRRVWVLRKWEVLRQLAEHHDWANETGDAVRLARVNARIERVLAMRCPCK